MERAFDTIVIGGGVVGLACAAELAREGSVLVLERHARVGMENSARNSGVVHAGVHHPVDFLKTRLCIRGRALLERRCIAEGIPYRRTGKLIVATRDPEEEQLVALARHAAELALPHRLLDRADVEHEEPAIRAHAALELSSTGILRATALVASLLAEVESRRGLVLTGVEVIAVELGASVHVVAIDGARFVAPRVVVAAGLASDRVASLAGLDPDALGIRQRYVRGVWHALAERHRKAVSHLVYPLPSSEALGVHLTRDLDGYLLAGPDAVPVATPDFALPAGGEDAFADAITRYYPAVVAADLHPCAVGVRPKLGAPGEVCDFALRFADSHRVSGLAILAGIESPGLTACLAIAEEVRTGLAVYT